MSQNKDKKDLSDSCLDALADVFSFKIIYYKDSKIIKSDRKKRVFTSPLVIRSDETNAYVMYTREEASLFAEDEKIKELFSKYEPSEGSKEEKNNEVNEEVKKLSQEKKVMEDSLKKKTKEIEDYKEVIKSLSERFDDFIDKTIYFVTTIKDPNNVKSLAKGKNSLISAKVFSDGLNTEICPDSIDKLSTQKANLKKEIKKLKRRLRKDKEDKGPDKKYCYACKTLCDFYNGTKLKCNHILDQGCLQEYS